ncbi:MAG: HD domain-containing protein [candidate division WOR-3 bacterium]|uniref:HD domain-containing protein n=1 Tax=candidate division WOR-3 bacterium TaxID=2052148 RepID=A0A7C1WI60_UNCW3|nr:HD domain-containing protein [candidate division WOR-3 bacterium]
MISEIHARLQSLGRTYDRLIELQADRQLYLVGGALRDILLYRPPQDFDFAVAGSAIEFARQFAQKIRGKLVILSEEDDEARVVYRKKITFDFNGLGTASIEADLMRRDFTINALALKLPAGEYIIDPYGGQEDIKRKLIRPVTDNTLARDPLRLLRAFRLALELGFTIDSAIEHQGANVSLARTAPERIGMEFMRILNNSGATDCIKRLIVLGRLVEIMPEMSALLEEPELREHTLRTFIKIEELLNTPGFFSRFQPEWNSYLNQDPPRAPLLKLAGLLHDIAKPHTRFINESGETHFYGHDSLGARLAVKIGYERLRLSRLQVRILRTLVREHMRLHLLATAPELSDRAIRRFFRDLGSEALGLMILCYADGWATAGRTIHLEDTITRMLNQQRMENARRRIKRLVTGHDLIALGMKPGPVFKVILQELEDLQIEGKITTKEEGIEYLKSYLKSRPQ